MALNKVSDYLDQARVLLQDNVADTARYTDAELMSSLSIAFLEARRIRPDLFITSLMTDPPDFTDANQTVPMDAQYRMALVYYVCGNAQLRDDEVSEDERASIFLNKFTNQMLVVQS